VRVVADSRRVEVEPGRSATVVLQVLNTADAIDAVGVNVSGVPVESVSVTPQRLQLSPNAAGKITVGVVVPSSFASGRHRLLVEVFSQDTASPPQCLDIDLDVVARPGLRARPNVVRAWCSARFTVELVNGGNVALDATLSAHDSNRAVHARFTPQRRRVEPGGMAPVVMAVRGRRMISGAEVDRSLTVEVTGRSGHRGRGRACGGEDRGGVAAATATESAGAFFARQTSAGDAATPQGQAPAAFSRQRASSVAPAGALPKTGQLPAGVGGEISGTVLAANDARPVGRILVQAYRMGPHGLIGTSSTTSRADGSYALAGLFPTGHYLKFSGAGYVTQWYPNRSTQAVTAIAQGVTADINVRIATRPASISGTVESGETLTTVTARPLLGPRTGKAIATTTARGGYRLAGLPAPGAYELTFTAPGYQESTLVDTVGGGEERLEPPVILGAGLGQISGIVSDGTRPLGGANVRTMVNGTPLDVITPTTGPVGAYTLTNLPTPASYVITYSSPGHGTITETVDLAARQRRPGVNVSLAIGADSRPERLPPVDPAPDGHRRDRSGTDCRHLRPRPARQALQVRCRRAERLRLLRPHHGRVGCRRCHVAAQRRRAVARRQARPRSLAAHAGRPHSDPRRGRDVESTASRSRRHAHRRRLRRRSAAGR
jgi:hypothetical protein